MHGGEQTCCKRCCAIAVPRAISHPKRRPAGCFGDLLSTEGRLLSCLEPKFAPSPAASAGGDWFDCGADAIIRDKTVPGPAGHFIPLCEAC